MPRHSKLKLTRSPVAAGNAMTDFDHLAGTLDAWHMRNQSREPSDSLSDVVIEIIDSGSRKTHHYLAAPSRRHIGTI